MNAKQLNEELDKYLVYNPKEVEEERKFGKDVHKGPYTSKDLRNMFIGTLNYPSNNAQDIIDSLRDAIDRMPDEWVAEFLRVQNNDIVEKVKLNKGIIIMKNAKELLESLNKLTEEKNRFNYEPKAGDLVVVYGSALLGSKSIFGIVVGLSEETSYYGKKQVALKPLCDSQGNEITNYSKDENGNILVNFDQIKPDKAYFERCVANAIERAERFKQLQKEI